MKLYGLKERYREMKGFKMKVYRSLRMM